MATSVVKYWNEAAVEANRVDHSRPLASRDQNGPTATSRVLAIVHLSIYDACIGALATQTAATVYPFKTPYTQTAIDAQPPTSLDVEIAVSYAAFEALSALYPSQRVLFVNTLEALNQSPSNPSNTAQSQAFGRDVARAMLRRRRNDPPADGRNYQPAGEPLYPNGLISNDPNAQQRREDTAKNERDPLRGKHIPDPINPMQGFESPAYANAVTYAVGQRYSLAAPPAADLTNAKYNTAFDQVRVLGVEPPNPVPPVPVMPPTTVEQLQLQVGVFWAYDGAFLIGAPARLYNQTIWQVVEKYIDPVLVMLDLKDQAALFALVAVAMVDAGILTWQEKYYDGRPCYTPGGTPETTALDPAGCVGQAEGHEFWRPIVGIRAEASANPTYGGWRPHGAPLSNQLGSRFSPNFPAYPSGHAAFGAAAFQMLRLFVQRALSTSATPKTFGRYEADDIAVTLLSDELNGKNRDNRGVIRPLVPRTFQNLWDVIFDNALSRIYLGIHWTFDAFAFDAAGTAPDLTQPVGGVTLGLRVANDIFDRYVAAAGSIECHELPLSARLCPDDAANVPAVLGNTTTPPSVGTFLTAYSTISSSGNYIPPVAPAALTANRNTPSGHASRKSTPSMSKTKRKRS